MKKFLTVVALACSAVGFAQSAQAAGNVEWANMQQMSGWACDPSQPLYQGQVMMYRDDGEWVGTAPVNVAREQAVTNACGGGTVHGFNATWQVNPALVDNKNHYVEFWYIGPQEVLIGRKRVGFCYSTISPSGLCPE